MLEIERAPAGEVPTVRWLGCPSCGDPEVVGGKAATLSRLRARGFAVPPGFCLSAELCRSDDLDPICRAYDQLSQECGDAPAVVAVRSSALDEDGADSSFAGQHETRLNVRGLAALVPAIRRCFKSFNSERALAYRRARGLPPAGSRAAILVQALVAADSSAVVFTADPISGDPDRMVVNTTLGLGELLVDGAVDPDTYVVRKRDLEIVDVRIASKELMSLPAEPGGTREVRVPRVMRREPAMPRDQVLALARLALELETEAGRPIDGEFAVSGGIAYLLQCRPITTLGRLPRPRLTCSSGRTIC